MAQTKEARKSGTSNGNGSRKPHGQPAQQQARRPGLESAMRPRPVSSGTRHKGSDKLRDKVALITGGDSASCFVFLASEDAA